MRQLQLPFYEPLPPAPERAALTLLHAALRVTERVLFDQHALDTHTEPSRTSGEAVVLHAAQLIVGRCAELRQLLDLYDAVIEQLHQDDAIPF